MRRSLKAVTELAVDGLATLCLCYVLDEDGAIELVVSAHADAQSAQRLLGVERFVSSERDGVRHVVMRAIDSRRSLLVRHVDEVWIAANATGDDHERFMREFDFRSLIVVPVTGSESGPPQRVLGVLVLVRTAAAGRRYPFERRDLTLAQELARRAGNALERSRQHTRELEYCRIVETTNDGILKCDLSDSGARITMANQQFAELLGYSDRTEVEGRAFLDFVAAADIAKVEPQRKRRREGIRAAHELRLRRRDGVVIWTHVTATPLVDVRGRFTGSLGVITNITNRKRSEQRLAFLAEIGTLLAAPTDAKDILNQLVDLVVQREIAECCVVYAGEQKNHVDFTPKASAHRDSTQRATFLTAPPAAIRTLVANVMRTGEPVLVPDCKLELTTAANGETIEQRAFDLHSLIAVPLMTHGRMFGTIVMLNKPPQTFLPDDFALAQSLASRAALRLDNARLLEQHQRDAAFQRFIAHASEVLLSSTLDLQATLQGLLRLVVPEFAQWGIVNLIDEHDGHAKAAAVVHAEPRKAQLASRLRGHTYLRPELSEVPHAIRTGTSQIVARVDEAYLQAIIRPEFLPTLKQIELGSSKLSVPLFAGGRLLGALTFARTRMYANSDLPLFEELARRAAVAILNAENFAHERRVADFLQSTSLPPKLPQLPGLRLHACYEAGKSDAQVGGDWYDAIALTDGRIVIAIGDVLGSGVEAARTMGALRQIIRGIVQINPEPSAILEATDRALRTEQVERYATAFVSIFDPSTTILSYASAGHPPPLLRQADGTIVQLTEGRGLPLGLRDHAAADPTAAIKLPTGSLLVLYTDGITEATRDVLQGERRLVTALGDLTVRESTNVARAIQQSVLRDGSRDDVAVLVVGVETVADPVAAPLPSATLAWAFDAHDAQAARRTRQLIVEQLNAYAASEDECHDAEVVFSELVSNVVRHAPGPIEVRLELRDRKPILHVLDEGPGFLRLANIPVSLMSERGRGLSVVSTLTEEFNVTRRPQPLSGSHARAVLSINRHALAT